MLKSAALIAFTATKEPERAKSFYRDVLGLALLEDSAFALVFDSNGTMLRIQKFPEHVPAKSTSIGWQVTDIRAAVDQLAANGVRFERYERLPQDERNIWRTPEGAEVAWFKDPDGNTLSLTQWPR